MRKYKALKTLVNDHISMLEKLDSMLGKIFIPWFKKRSVLFSDIQQEERDLLHFIKTDLTPFLKNQRKEARKLFEKINKICEK